MSYFFTAFDVNIDVSNHKIQLITIPCAIVYEFDSTTIRPTAVWKIVFNLKWGLNKFKVSYLHRCKYSIWPVLQ